MGRLGLHCLDFRDAFEAKRQDHGRHAAPGRTAEAFADVVVQRAVGGIVRRDGLAVHRKFLAGLVDFGLLVRGEVDEPEVLFLGRLERRLQQLLVFDGLFREAGRNSHGARHERLGFGNNVFDLLFRMVDADGAQLLVS